MRKDKTTDSRFTATGPDDLWSKLKAFSKRHKGVHTATLTFDTVTVRTWKFPSAVTPASVSDLHPDLCGFFKDGKFHKFSTDFVAKKTKTSSKKRFSVFSGS